MARHWGNPLTDIFISYARSTASQAHKVAEALRALGYSVWLDDDLPAHRAYAEVIEERLAAAKAVVVIWSAEAVRSHWVFSEANRGREGAKLVQLSLDATRLPMPFDTLQCADMTGWSGDLGTPGWRKVVANIGELVGVSTAGIAETPLTQLGKPSIAVMPFANLSGDPEQEYFADGMVVEITNALSCFKTLFVIGSGSSLSFKGKGVRHQDAARQLGVRYLLEGTVRKGGNRVRITVQLIDASDGAQIWTERFEDTLEDVFALQDRITLSVAGKIEPMVETAETRRGSSRPPANLGSYDLYLRALPRFRTLGSIGTLEALELLNRAITLDPNFGPALAAGALCHRNIHVNRWSDDPEGNRRQGLELAHRALMVSGDDADVLSRVAIARAYLGEDQEAAMALADRAIALNPGSSAVWANSGGVRLLAGRLDLAIQHSETSMRLDPMGPMRSIQVSVMGPARFLQGRFTEAVGLLREGAEQRDNPVNQGFLAACLGQLGQTREAQAALRRYRTFSPQPIGDFLRTFASDPTHIQLFRDGIALAEGKSPDGESG